jgi:carbon storage regulator CsrA
MLVLARPIGSSVLVGPIGFKIVRIDGSRVRVGITAPQDWSIHRDDVLREIGERDPKGLRMLGYGLTADGVIAPQWVLDEAA